MRQDSSKCRLLKLKFCLATFLLCAGICCPLAPVAAQSTDQQLQAIHMRRQLEDAFSPVGTWTITKMDVVYVGELGRASTAEADPHRVNAKLKSSLSEIGTFTVGEDGAITGNGTALYEIRVSGKNAASGDWPVAPSVPIPAGATAVGSGNRDFTVTGTANLKRGIVSLKAFPVKGGPVEVNVVPGGGTVSFVAWSPMTNIEGPVVTNGASLLLRGAGTVGKFHIQFEAVKHVDLRPLFEMLLSGGGTAGNGIRGSDGTGASNGAEGSGTAVGQAGQEGENATSRQDAKDQTRWRAGSLVVSAGRPVKVTFRKPLHGNYTVSLTPQSHRGDYVVGYTTKTATGFNIHLQAKQKVRGRVRIDWLAVPH